MLRIVVLVKWSYTCVKIIVMLEFCMSTMSTTKTYPIKPNLLWELNFVQ